MLGHQVVAQGDEALVPGDRADRRQRDRDGEGEREPGVEADPEEDQPHALAPGQQPAGDRVQGAADEDVVTARTWHRRGELGVHPEQGERHHEGADHDRQQHAAAREVARRLQEHEDRAEGDVHAQRVHDQGVPLGHLSDQAGRVAYEQLSTLGEVRGDRDLCHLIPPVQRWVLGCPRGARAGPESVVFASTALDGEAEVLRSVEHPGVLDRSVLLVTGDADDLEQRAAGVRASRSASSSPARPTSTMLSADVISSPWTSASASYSEPSPRSWAAIPFW